MGMLDFLISDNKEPKDGMEYVYLLDMMWEINTCKSYPIKFGSIVTNVVKQENRAFNFTVKETGKRYETNYGWYLTEHTPENMNKINIYLESLEKLKKLEEETKNLRRMITDLSPI